MPNTILAALPGEQVVQTNSLATVTRNCLVIRDSDGQLHTIISLSRITGIKTIRKSYPGVLVVAAGLALIAAAAFCSKQGAGAGPPIAGLAALFVLGYFGSRRAAVAFLMGRESTETAYGGLRKAAQLVRAVREAQTANVDETN
jgi:hypothetical protein